MSGLLITLRKNPFRYFENNSHENVLLGHYDRLEVRESFIFPDFYFSAPENSKPAKDKLPNDNGLINPASYGETQRIYLLRLPARDDFEESKKEDIEIPPAFRDLQPKSGKNSSIPYDIAQKRICCISKDTFIPRYFTISLLSLSEFADSYFSRLAPRRRLFNKMEIHITRYLEENYKVSCPHIYFEIFSLIGSGDIGILWYTEDITLPAKCLQQLKSVVFSAEEIPLVFSTYSVITLLPCNSPNLAICKEEYEDVYVDVNINYKGNADPEYILRELEKKLLNNYKIEEKWMRYGNHDTTVRIPANRVPLSLYCPNECESGKDGFYLDFRSKIFRDNCLQVYTRLIFLKDDRYADRIQIDYGDEQYDEFNHEAIEKFNEQKGQNPDDVKNAELEKLSKLTNEIIDPDLYGKRDKKYEIFLRAPNLQESIAQTFHGLTRIITSGHNNMWWTDLCDQYKAVILAIEHMAKQDEKRKNGNSQETYEAIVRLLRALQQTYGHIEQGSRAFFDAPGSGLSYAGSHKRAIWAYYGIVKLFIEIIYRLKRKGEQKKLIPILEFLDTPLIESTPYAYESDSEECSLLICTLPYTSLYNMPKYIRFLAHELFHYCSSSDRYTRNRILSVYTIAQMLSHYMESAIAASKPKSDSNTPGKWTGSGFEKFIGQCCSGIAFSFVNENYDEIISGLYDLKSVNTIAKDYLYPEAPWDIYSEHLASMFNFQSWKKIEHLYCVRPSVNGVFQLFRKWCGDNENLSKEINKLISNVSIASIKEIEKVIQDIEDFCSKDESDFTEALEEVFREEDEKSDYLGAILAYAYGELEAGCDNFMRQITKLALSGVPKNVAQQIKEDEKYYYLNLIADYLYARGSNIMELKKNGGSYCIRLGIQLHQLFLEDKESITEEQKIGILSECLGKWKADNERIRDNRDYENRNSARIRFRIDECVDLFVSMYTQFVDKRGHHFIKSSAYCLSNFEYIFENMFESEGNQERENDSKALFRSRVNVFRRFSEKYYKIQNQDWKKIRNVLCFDLHGELIEYFNRQHSFRKLNEIHEEIVKEKSALKLSDKAQERFSILASYGLHFSPYWKYDVYTFKDFFDRYSELSKRLINNGAKFIWYRGMENSTFKLTPSLYRSILKIRKDSKPVLNERISDFQQMYLDQFMARVSESSEINDLRMMGAIDWIACMQHYRAPTNLLDWSENLLIALYFMLEPLILSELDKNKPDEEKNLEIEKRKGISSTNGVSLYLFDPIAYNTLWLEKKSAQSNQIKDIYLSKRMPLPNLSMAYNANQFAAYVLGDPRDKVCSLLEEDKCDGCAFQNPIAILTGQSNPRLKTQAGTFLAFSLCNETDKLEEASVESLQEEWLKDNINPFMYKITLKGADALEEITKWTLMAGMSTYKVYPDLQNIGLYVKDSTE